MQLRLGLDVGSNSLGWALIRLDPDSDTVEGNGVGEIIRMGVRIFPEGVDRDKNKLEQSKMVERRQARLMRRQLERRARRKDWVRELLTTSGLLPADEGEFALLLRLDPYSLRAAAVSRRLTPHEFGRALLHLNQRRGFKSNRKQGVGKEDGPVLGSIGAIKKAMQEAGAATYGAYLAARADADRRRNRKDPFVDRDLKEVQNEVRERQKAERAARKETGAPKGKKRKKGEASPETASTDSDAPTPPAAEPAFSRPVLLYADRGLIEAEFAMMWERQSAEHPTLLTPELKARIHKAIFTQRDLKPGRVGDCEFLPGHKRALRATWLAQDVRILQDVNNLGFFVPGKRDAVPLPEEQRALVHEELAAGRDLTPKQVAALLSLAADTRFTFERGKNPSLRGNPVEKALRKILGDRFDERPDHWRGPFWNALLGANDEEFERRARAEGLSSDQVGALFDAFRAMPDGFARLSDEAMRRLHPHLRAGMKLHFARTAAGLDPIPDRACDLLPEAPQQIANAVVRTALVEVRRVVNAIIREHGKPDLITVELGKETRGTSTERNERLDHIKKREQENRTLDDRLRELGVLAPNGTARLKLRLWEEQQKACIYSGRPIGANDLFAPDNRIQIDHVLPYSRSLDDSVSNKVVCWTAENQKKGEKTPLEAFGGDEEKWRGIMSRVERLGDWRKRRKFTQQEVESEGWIARQLTDMQYISRVAREYLQQLYPPDRRLAAVRATRGAVTAHLRHLWGLNSVLWDLQGLENQQERRESKLRADHRHHAIDALVVALSEPKHIRAMGSRFDEVAEKVRNFPDPWPSFHADVVKHVAAILVSHRVDRRVSGALHEETSYGATGMTDDKTNKPLFVRRKMLGDLTEAMIDKIRDPAVRKLVRRRVDQHGGLKGAFDTPLYLPNRNGPPVRIRHVRVLEPMGGAYPITRPGDDKPYRWVKGGANHHVAFFEFEDEKGRTRRVDRVVPLFELAQRLVENRRREKRGEPTLPLIDHRHPDFPHARFLFSLAINDMVRAADREKEPDAPPRLYRVQTISEGDIRLRLHTAATIDNDAERLRLTSFDPDRKHLQKVVVDVLGREVPARD